MAVVHEASLATMLILDFQLRKQGESPAASQITAARNAQHLVGVRIPTMMLAGMSTANARRRKLLLRAKAREPVEKVKAKVAVIKARAKAKAKAPTRRVGKPALKLLVMSRRLEPLLLELIPHFLVTASVWIHGQMCT